MATIHLIDADPDLGRHLPPGRLEGARRELVAELWRVRRGPADVYDHAPDTVSGMGLLLLDGLVERDVVVADTVSAELLGPGDLIRRAALADSTKLLGVTINWDVLADARFAVLNERVAPALRRYPEVAAVLTDRLVERVHRLSTAQAISQLNGVDRRLLALFWHLGERWGRVSPKGLLVPLDLPHRVLAQLVGARRPTVSTALRRLDERGDLRRRDDGAWVIDRASAAEWVPPDVHRGAPRRLRVVEPADGVAPLATPLFNGASSHFRPELAAVRATTNRHLSSLREACERAAELRLRNQETLERCRLAQERMREAAERPRGTASSAG
jgi:CRP/FNR family transcriptional regulator, cyclic AMP receptor protein